MVEVFNHGDVEARIKRRITEVFGDVKCTYYEEAFRDDLEADNENE